MSERDSAAAIRKGQIPQQIAHLVLSTKQIDEMQKWYCSVFDAHVVFASPQVAFLTYDEEHHRIALIRRGEDYENPVSKSVGVDHVAFSFLNLRGLLDLYKRLEDESILPVWTINHGPTISFYYEDPDGNRLEFQTDNFATVQEATDFFYTPAFQANPIGVEVDPNDLLARLDAGEPESEIVKRPDIGQRFKR